MRIRPYFSFEATFGWSEVIAVVALVFALLAFVDERQGGQPAISLVEFPIVVGAVRDSRSGRDVFATTIPLVFTNSGGRATSLVTFRPNETVAPLLFMVDGGASARAAPFEFFLLTRMIDTAQEWETFLPLLKAFDPVAQPPLLNLSIPAGESRVVYVAVVADVYGRKVSDLLVALEAEFSHGASQPIRAAIDVRPPPDGK